MSSLRTAIIFLYIRMVQVIAVLAPLTAAAAFVPAVSPPVTSTSSWLNTARVGSLPSTPAAFRRCRTIAPTAAARLSRAVFSSATPAIEATEDVLRSWVGLVGMQLPTSALALSLSDGLLDDPTKVALFALGGLAVAAAGFQTAVYWRMQYVVAALLSNRVPMIKGGAEVLELSAKDTKTLYYMPTGGVRRVTLSTVKDLEEEIVNGAAIQAKIPTALARKQEAGRLSCATATMDCVVSVFGFSGGVSAGTVTSKELASEVARVLKPGGTLLFVEKGEARGLVEELSEALGTVEVNIVRNLFDPYCVGLGTNTKVTGDDARDATPSGEREEGNRRTRRLKKKAAGAEK